MKNVLVVDDSKMSRMFIIQALEMAGLGGSNFIEAANGEEALVCLRQQGGLAALVTDINMPKKCGMTLIKEIKEQSLNDGFVIVVISSAQNPTRDAELKNLGAAAVLQKPLQMPQLIAALSPLKMGA